MPPMLRPWIALALAVAAGGCGDDNGSSESCTAPDREALCPDEFAFEAFVSDLENGDAVFEALVAERLDDVNATTSAPNGRAVLCLPAGDRELTAAKEGYLPRGDTLDACAVSRAASAAQPYPIQMATAEFFDAELTSHVLTRDDSATQLLIAVRRYPDGDPIAGATVEIDAESHGDYSLGDLIAFANVFGEGDVALSFTAPDGVDCSGPDRARLTPGGITGVLFACE